MHALLNAEDSGTILFGRPGKDSGQDARSTDGKIVYQAKFRQNMTIGNAVDITKGELVNIRKYRQPSHPNYKHWKEAQTCSTPLKIKIQIL